MAYSQGLQTRYINPVYHDGYQRTRFELPQGSTYMSNLRIVGIGATVPAGDPSTEANALIGVLAGIRHIFLYQNGSLIDQKREFNRWAAFHIGYNTSNEVNTNSNRYMLQNTFGFDMDEDNGVIESSAPEPELLTNDAATTCTGNCYLKSIFGLLSQLDMLPPSLGNLSIEIEWDTRDDTLNPSGAIESFLRPLLVADYSDVPAVTKAAEKALEKNITYHTVVHDVAYVDPIAVSATSPNITQSLTFRPRGFDGKNVRSLLVAQEPTFAPSQTGRLGSLARHEGVDRFVVNGAQVYGAAGLDTTARRLTALSDTYGVCNTLPGAAQTAFPDAANHIADPDGLVGYLDFTGVGIGQVVNDMQHEWSRTGNFDAAATSQVIVPENMPCTLHYFADVQRVRQGNGAVTEL